MKLYSLLCVILCFFSSLVAMQDDQPPSFERLSGNSINRMVSLWKLEAAEQKKVAEIKKITDLKVDSQSQPIFDKALRGKLDEASLILDTLATYTNSDSYEVRNEKVYKTILHTIKNTWSEAVILRFFNDSKRFDTHVVPMLETHPMRYIEMARVLSEKLSAQPERDRLLHACLKKGYERTSDKTSQEAKEALATLLEFYEMAPAYAKADDLSVYAKNFIDSDQPFDEFDTSKPLYAAQERRVSFASPDVAAKKKEKKRRQAERKNVPTEAPKADVLSEELKEAHQNFLQDNTAESLSKLISIAIADAKNENKAAQSFLVTAMQKGIDGRMLLVENRQRIRKEVPHLSYVSETSAHKSVYTALCEMIDGAKVHSLAPLCERAKTQKDAKTLLLLSDMYRLGRGVTKSYVRAYELFREAMGSKSEEMEKNYRYVHNNVFLPFCKDGYLPALYLQTSHILDEIERLSDCNDLVGIEKLKENLLETIQLLEANEAHEKASQFSLVDLLCGGKVLDPLERIKKFEIKADVTLFLSAIAAKRLKRIMSKVAPDVRDIGHAIKVLELFEGVIHQHLINCFEQGKSLSGSTFVLSALKGLPEALKDIKKYGKGTYAKFNLRVVEKLDNLLKVLSHDIDASSLAQSLAELSSSGVSAGTLKLIEILHMKDIEKDTLLVLPYKLSKQADVVKWYFKAQFNYATKNYDEGLKNIYMFLHVSRIHLTVQEYDQLFDFVKPDELFFHMIPEYNSKVGKLTINEQYYLATEIIFRYAHFNLLLRNENLSEERRKEYTENAAKELDSILGLDEIYGACYLAGELVDGEILQTDWHLVSKCLLSAIGHATKHAIGSKSAELVNRTYMSAISKLLQEKIMCELEEKPFEHETIYNDLAQAYKEYVQKEKLIVV